MHDTEASRATCQLVADKLLAEADRLEQMADKMTGADRLATLARARVTRDQVAALLSAVDEDEAE